MRKKLISSLLAGSLGVGCSGEQVESPRVPENSLVVWTGDHPALGSVRWGYRENDYHAVSYPRAKNREDKTLLIEHEIPLLSVRNG